MFNRFERFMKKLQLDSCSHSQYLLKVLSFFFPIYFDMKNVLSVGTRQMFFS